MVYTTGFGNKENNISMVKITSKRQDEGNSQTVESRTMFLLRNICVI